MARCTVYSAMMRWTRAITLRSARVVAGRRILQRRRGHADEELAESPAVRRQHRLSHPERQDLSVSSLTKACAPMRKTLCPCYQHKYLQRDVRNKTAIFAGLATLPGNPDGSVLVQRVESHPGIPTFLPAPTLRLCALSLFEHYSGGIAVSDQPCFTSAQSIYHQSVGN